MSCKALLYTVNQGAQAVAVGGTIPLGSINRRFGCGLNLNGNGIIADRPGYYDISAAVTIQATAAGVVTVNMLRDGVLIPGATASATAAAGDFVTLPLIPADRINCDGSGHTLTLVLTAGAGTVTNVVTKSIKL